MDKSTDLLLALDPVRMATSIGYELDPWQQAMVRSRRPRQLLNIHRQGGKSLCCAIVAVHQALYEPDSPVLMVSPSQRQSSELFRTALALYRSLGKPVAPEIENRLSLELENGSRIVSLPGSEQTVRSFSAVKLLIVDEAARVPDALMAAIRPFLATSGGRLIAPSTPAGRRGWWYEAWTNGGDTWERYKVRADQCPRISKEFLAEERRALGPSWFSAEYKCEFTNVEGSVFPEHYLQRILSTEEHAWKIPPPSWAQPTQQSQPTQPQSWTAEIRRNPPKQDPRMTPYGIPAFP